MTETNGTGAANGGGGLFESVAKGGPYRVLRLTVENFKRISALMVELDAGLNIVSGPNESGKSTALRALWAALGGGAAAWTETPIKVGHATASIDLSIVDRSGAPCCTVSLKFRRGSEPKIEVRDAAGKNVSAAATFLKTLVGAGIAWDPNAFADPRGETTVEGRNKKRVEILFRACPLGIDLAAHEARRKKAFDDRRDANRDAKSLEVAVGAMVEPDEKIPDVVDVAAAESAVLAADNANAEIETAKREARSHRARLDEVDQEIAALEDRLGKLRTSRASLVTSVDAADLVAKRAPVDAADAREKLRLGRAANVERGLIAERNKARARRRDERKARAERADAASKRAVELDVEVKRLDKVKADAIVAAKLPAGLTLDESGPVLDGLPYEDASQRRRLEVALEVGLALSGPLRLILLSNGNDFDKPSIERLFTWCAERGVQVVSERIESVPDVGGFEIVAGARAEDAPASSGVAA